MVQLNFYPYYSRDIQLIASAFWVDELKRRINTETVAGVYRYLAEHEDAKHWVKLDKSSKFLYLKQSMSPLKTKGKIERYDKVFFGLSKILEHPLFRLLGSSSLTECFQYKERLTALLNDLPHREKDAIQSALPYIETNHYSFTKEQKTIELLTKKLSIHTFTALLLLYLFYQTTFLNWPIRLRLEKEIFYQFVHLFCFKLENKWAWFVYQNIEQHMLNLEENYYSLKPTVMIKNKSQYPLPHQLIFFDRFNTQHELTTYTDRHFTM